MTAFENVLYEVDGGVATVTMNRPDELNAITHGPGSMQDDIVRALERADSDDAVRCIVVTGAGRAFSSGGAVKGIKPPDTAAGWVAFHKRNNAANDRIRNLAKPVVGAVNGICYGAGLTMITHFDIVLASDRARFGLIEARFGAPGVDMLIYHVGPQWAKFLAISGELIDARKAKEIGLVLEVIPHDRLAIRADDLARRVASVPADTVVLNRRLVNGALEAMGWSAQKQLTISLNASINGTMDRALAADGRSLMAILRDDGWRAFKQARDAPFEPPWLTDDYEPTGEGGARDADDAPAT